MLSRRWRLTVPVVVVLLVVTLGILHGPVEAGLAGLLVAPCVVALPLVVGTGRRGVLFAVGVLALFAVLYAWSQLLPGVDHPPLPEWGLASGLLGAVLCGVAVKMFRPSSDQVRDAAIVLAIFPLLACCLAGGRLSRRRTLRP